MIEAPDRVTIVFGYVPAANLCALLAYSSVWILWSDENRREVTLAFEAMDLATLPGQISFSVREPNEALADWLCSTLESVDEHHDGSLWTEWQQIDVIGLEFAPVVERVAREFGNVSPSGDGFRISRADDDR